jgi:hypothetical protein
MGEEFLTRIASANVNATDVVRQLRDEVRNCNDYNTSLLPALISGPILREYQSVAAVGSARADSISLLRGLSHDLDFRQRKLKSIIGRLELWAVQVHS